MAKTTAKAEHTKDEPSNPDKARAGDQSDNKVGASDHKPGAAEQTQKDSDSSAPSSTSQATDQVTEAIKQTDHEPDTNRPQTASESDDSQSVQSAEAATEATKKDNGETAPTKPAVKKHWAFLHTSLHTKKGKVLLGLGVVIVLIGVLLAVPTTRYGILGSVVKKNITVTAVDSKTGKPVSSLSLTLDGQTVKTDAVGVATFRNVPVGPHKIDSIKRYYKNVTLQADVPIFSEPAKIELKVAATGRQVVIKVTNKISGKPLAKATVAIHDTSAITDNKGETTLVLPADKTSLTGAIKADGYNDQGVTIQVTEDKTDKNTFAITPSGKVYFLSKRTGTVNVMKSNLDGSDAKTVVAGTGKEESGSTLLATRDWKYLALHSERDDESANLYLIDTATDKMTVIDEGKANFNPVGWYNHRFFYTVTRLDVNGWAPKHQAFKSYNAQTGKITILDESNAAGTGPADYAAENFSGALILEDEIIYTKSITKPYTPNGWLPGVPASIVSIKPDGSGKKVVKTFDAGYGSKFIYGKLYKPQEAYFRVDNQNALSGTFYEYEHGKLSSLTNLTDALFYGKAYPTYLYSPDGQKTFWSDPRDGKQTLFVGDKDGENGKEILSISEYNTYGWFTNDYLLVSKNSSELYIMPATGGGKPFKITDYHKPSHDSYAYGYGYGGL